jgi:uncharacterized protein YmfQ (DUF2313 family)
MLSKFIQLSKQLLPKGRLFSIPDDGTREKLNNEDAYWNNKASDDIKGILNAILPDNANFTVEDATLWEQRLGLITNTATSLENRKLAIKRKMNYPGNILARQSSDYIQDQLQAVGFDVYVHENLPFQTVENSLGAAVGIIQMGEGEMGDDNEMGNVYEFFSDLFSTYEMGDDAEMGTVEMGGVHFKNIVANRIDEIQDQWHGTGSDNSNIFFIGGEIFGTFADVDETRKDEFRQLILKLKPTQTVAFLLINYT